jgi:hypothetical protein
MYDILQKSRTVVGNLEKSMDRKYSMRCTKLNWEYKNTLDTEHQKLREEFERQQKNNFAIIENKSNEIQTLTNR